MQELLVHCRLLKLNEQMSAYVVPEQQLPHATPQQRQALVGLVLDSGAGRGPFLPAADHHALSARAEACPPAATGPVRLQQQRKSVYWRISAAVNARPPAAGCTSFLQVWVLAQVNATGG